MKNGAIAVGAGLAGMMAAIAASDEGAEVVTLKAIRTQYTISRRLP